MNAFTTGPGPPIRKGRQPNLVSEKTCYVSSETFTLLVSEPASWRVLTQMDHIWQRNIATSYIRVSWLLTWQN